MYKVKPKYNSIRVNDTAKSTIKMLSTRIGKTEYDFANKMVEFINKTGLDVYSDTLPNIPDLIKNLDKRMVSFLKKREQDFFVPMDKSFKKMIELHRRTFESLETLDVLRYSEYSNTLVAPNNQESPLISPKTPAVEAPNNTPIKETTLTPLSDEEKENFLIKIDRAEKEKKTFESELKFLLDNITTSKSISGPKFVCNLSHRDIDRIKVLLGDN